jgi:hypothetical protein
MLEEACRPIMDRSQPHRSDIMIVDDNPANLTKAVGRHAAMLLHQGYEVRSFPLEAGAGGGREGSTRLDSAGYHHARDERL